MGNFQARLRLGAAAAFTLFSLGACNDSGSSGSGTTPGSATLAQQMIGPSGGTMTVTDPTSPYVGTSITVPAGALATTTTLTLSQVSGDPNVPANAYEFALGPSGTQFAVPVTITVKYNPAYLSSNGIADATTLKIVSMDPGVANQTLLTTAQDTVNDTITAQTTHFSSFVALGYTTATLNGTYHFVSYSFNSTTTNPVIVPFSVPSTPYSNNLTVPI